MFLLIMFYLFSLPWYIRSPDTARVRSKMIYASSKDRFKRELDGIQVELQATDPTEMDIDVIRSRANWTWISISRVILARESSSMQSSLHHWFCKFASRRKVGMLLLCAVSALVLGWVLYFGKGLDGLLHSFFIISVCWSYLFGSLECI